LVNVDIGQENGAEPVLEYMWESSLLRCAAECAWLCGIGPLRSSSFIVLRTVEGLLSYHLCEAKKFVGASE
jgi:hypothetical protein